jgi:plastocyanin
MKANLFHRVLRFNRYYPQTFCGRVVSLLAIVALASLIFGFSTALSASPAQCNMVNRDFKCQIDIIEESQPGPYFEPQGIVVLKGAELQWRNIDPTNSIHWIASTDSDTNIPNPTPNGVFDTGVINPQSSSISVVLNGAGRHHYFCRIHPWMRGETTVLDQWVPEFPASVGLALAVAVATMLVVLRKMPLIRTLPVS